MFRFKKTILPLWYIVGILVLVLGSLFLFLGTRYTVQVGDVNLATKLVVFDWMMIGVWFIVNIAILVWLVSQKAPRSDFLYPIYFVSLHGVFAILIIAGEVFGSYAPSWIVFLLGLVSSMIELFFVFYLFGCYKLSVEKICELNLKTDLRKPIVSQQSVKKQVKKKTSSKKSSSKSSQKKKTSSVKKPHRSKKK